MECPEGEVPSSSENDSTIAPTLEVMNYQESQISVDHGAEIVCECSAETDGNKSTEILADQGAKTDADSSTTPADKTTLENPQEVKKMSKNQDEPPHELENQFILRLPQEHASTVRSLIHSGSVKMKDKLKIDLSPDRRHAVVEVEDVSLSAKLVDLPCVIGSLKTLDKKTFYKTADISQMLVCSADADLHSSLEEPITSTDVSITGNNERETEKKYIWKHGITPPLKNVRKKRFRKTKKKTADFKQIEEITFTEYIDSPDVEKEVKRLLCSDAEAVSARWEVIADDETKEIESQGCIPGFPISPGMSGYKQGHISEYDMLPEMFSDSSSNNHDDEDEDEDEEDEEEEEEEDDDEDDEDEDEEEEEEEVEEDDSEEALERELQAKIFECSQYETKESVNSIVVEIQKHIHYKEKKLQLIQSKAQRQKDLIRKVENLTLKSHLHSVLERLKIQEKQKNDQVRNHFPTGAIEIFSEEVRRVFNLAINIGFSIKTSYCVKLYMFLSL
uniref:transcription initiation factor TFIID subunit 7-like n=1 Tax=Urocitellus parryii TaxID=9999 RepID=UPI000E55EB69|nr:transcription initiation factor TFIID subunit 7-like [Urocitellus parryii]